MVVEYRIRADEDYYVTAYARYRRQLWWYRWYWRAKVLAWIALVALIYLALIYSSKGAPAAWPPIWLFLFLPLGVALFFASLRGAVSRRRIRKIPTLNDDWVIRLSDDGVSSSSKRSEGRLDWSGFSKGAELRRRPLAVSRAPSVSLVSQQRVHPPGTVRRGRSGEASRFRLPRRRAACFVRGNTNGRRLNAGDGQ